MSFFNVLVLIVLISSLSVSTDGEFLSEPKYWVKVWNGLSSHKPLTIHCRSKEDDLGVRVLEFENVFKWSFRPMNHYFGYTLFWCNFNWEGHHASGEVYNESDWMLELCGVNNERECVWVARDDGVYIKSTKYEAYLRFYNWTSVSSLS